MTTATINKSAGSVKKDKTIYWIFTLLIVLLDSVPAIFSNTPPAIEGIRHLGFPDYFRIELGIGKIIGGILLVIPAIPRRFKEWAYVGFGISFISATIGHIAVGDGPGLTIMPLVGLVILMISYIYFHKTRSN